MVPPPLEVVYRSSRLALTRLAYLLVGDRIEAEDIVQTVFTTAAARWETIKDPPAYLRRAVVNRANDVHRRSFRFAASTVPTDSSIEQPEIDEVWRLVQGLPTAQRAVVVLRFYEDLGLGEIATVLGRPASTVRSDLRRALTRLKGCAGVNEMDELDDLERELGPSLRGALRRAAAEVTAGGSATSPWASDREPLQRPVQEGVTMVELEPATRADAGAASDIGDASVSPSSSPPPRLSLP